jgi:hypothetical protein
MRRERGQASVEWVAALLLVVVVLAGAAVAVEAPWLARALRCAVLAGCQGEEAELGRAYGDELAELVRRYAPNIAYEPGTYTLPVDFRQCRRHWCADAPDRPGLDVNRSTRGDRQATVFTHVVDWRSSGGGVYVQYWLYYPDSNWNARLHLGHHEDDWESFQLHVDEHGRVWTRASAHHGYAGRKGFVNNLSQSGHMPESLKADGWTESTGWTRVSKGSHAGHIPKRPQWRDRLTLADGLRFVPIETLSDADRATRFPISPPWDKAVYTDPESRDT